ncbi:MAG: DNA polymerase III subunit delta [Candidatus Magasanikbacteria bacterium]|nr:DNA polymerase III subunit delta [Candidatus Magasanikbacteria bacterium]MBT4071448.1 DNA polymerase III subunit delta [Candidatus Magasanikbacteria bacterium]
MIIFLYGKDTFRSHVQLQRMVDKFKVDRDPQGYNVVHCDMNVTAEEMLWEQIHASPFLAEKRLVVVENLLTAGSDALLKTMLTHVEEKTIPSSTIVLIIAGGEKYRKKIVKQLFERLVKEKFAQEFQPLEGAHIEGWGAAEIKEQGGTISREALQYVCVQAGNDLWSLSGILAQCVAYAREKDGAPREITISDVQLFVDKRADENIFSLVDAIVGKKPKQVFAMIQEQYRIGKDPHYVFAMLLRQFRILLQIRDMYEREDGLRSGDIAKKMSIHPFVAKKSFAMIRMYTSETLQDIYEALLDIDVSFKQSAGAPEALIDSFVGRVCLEPV